jgi:hypothetical protein
MVCNEHLGRHPGGGLSSPGRQILAGSVLAVCSFSLQWQLTAASPDDHGNRGNAEHPAFRSAYVTVFATLVNYIVVVSLVSQYRHRDQMQKFKGLQSNSLGWFHVDCFEGYGLQPARKGRVSVQAGYWLRELQIPPLRSPGFPVEFSGFHELHAAFFTESRTRCPFYGRAAGNPGTLCRKTFP